MIAQQDLVGAARLFGRLLLLELDRETLDELRAPAVQTALAELGVQVPPDGVDLENLSTEFCAEVLYPRGGRPLVQSLWVEGEHGGAATQSVRRFAAAVGLEPGAGGRGAPADHLGCMLHLWADLTVLNPDLAAQFAREHFGWLGATTSGSAARSTFYGSVLRAAAALADLLR